VSADSLRVIGGERHIEALLSRSPDSLNIYVTIIQKTDCPKCEEDIKKLKKQVLIWRIAAGVFLFVATGHILGLGQ